MAKNAVQVALNRADAKQATRNEQVISEARQNISLASMKDVKEVSPPLSTPSKTPPNPHGLDQVRLSPETQANIEAIGRVQGNKELTQNAVDRTLNRQATLHEVQPRQPEQGHER